MPKFKDSFGNEYEIEVKDGECKCKILTPCAEVLYDAWNKDKEIFGEMFGDILCDETGIAVWKATPQLGNIFKNLETIEEARNYIKEKLPYYEKERITEEMINNISCDTARELLDFLKEEIKK